MKKYIIPIITVLAFASALLITVNRDKSPATTRAAEYQIYSPLKVHGYMVLNPVTNLPATPGPMWLVNHNDTLKYYGEDNQWHSLLVGEALGDSSWAQVAVDSVKAQNHLVGLKFVIDNTYPGTTLYSLGSTYKFLMFNHPGMIRLSDLPNVTYDYGTAAYATKGTLFQPFDRDSLYYYNGTVWQALNKLGGGTGGGLSEPLNLSQPITSTSSTPYISKISGTKSFTFHHHGSENKFILAPSESVDGTDWDWANQFTFEDDGDFSAIGRIDANSNGGSGGYISSGDYGGTGSAAYFPEGIYSAGTNSWFPNTVQFAGILRDYSENEIWAINSSGNTWFNNVFKVGSKFTINNAADSTTIRFNHPYGYGVNAIQIDSASEAAIDVRHSNRGFIAQDITNIAYHAENTDIGFYSSAAASAHFLADDIFEVSDSTYCLYLDRATNDKMFAVITPSGAFDTAWLDPMAIGLTDALLDPEAWLADTLNGEGKWVYVEKGKRIEVYGLPKGINSIEAIQYMTEMLIRLAAEHQKRIAVLEQQVNNLTTQVERLTTAVDNITIQDKAILKNPFKRVNAFTILIGQFLLIATGLFCYLIGHRK